MPYVIESHYITYVRIQSSMNEHRGTKPQNFLLWGGGGWGTPIKKMVSMLEHNSFLVFLKKVFHKHFFQTK